jgi:uncharacterized protein (DUF779 family)
MFYQAGGCCRGSQPQCEKGVLSENGRCMYWTIEGTDLGWQDLFEYLHAHFTWVIDAFGVGGFSLETPLKKLSKLNIVFTWGGAKLRTRKIHWVN